MRGSEPGCGWAVGKIAKDVVSETTGGDRVSDTTPLTIIQEYCTPSKGNCQEGKSQISSVWRVSQFTNRAV